MLDKKILGKQLRIARLKKNLSQYDLEKLADVDQRLITRYENGLSFPKLDSFVKLINALEINIKDILQLQNFDASYQKLIYEISYLTPKQVNFVEGIIEKLIETNLK